MPPAMNRKSCARWRQAKIVDRRGHHQLVAGFHVVDQVARAAAAVALALDRDLIAVALGRIVAQRIFAQQAVRHPDSDMRAGGKFRQRLSRLGREIQGVDAVGDPVVARHAQRHRIGGSVAVIVSPKGGRGPTSGDFMREGKGITRARQRAPVLTRSMRTRAGSRLPVRLSAVIAP